MRCYWKYSVRILEIKVQLKKQSLLLFSQSLLTPSEMQDFSPNFLVKKFSANVQFLHIFVPIVQKSAEISRLRKISSPKN